MMLPVHISVTPFAQTPPALVNASIPGTAISRVLPDMVAPSVSSAQTNPNARGNNGAPLSLPATTAQPVTSANLPGFSAYVGSTPVSLYAGPGITFLAQIIGQGTANDMPAILAEYERMVALSEVKYRPSNAGVPQADATEIFKQALQVEKAHAANPAFASAIAIETHAAALQPAPTAIRTNAPQATHAGKSAPAAQTQAAKRLGALVAYSTTIERNASPSQKRDNDTIESI